MTDYKGGSQKTGDPAKAGYSVFFNADNEFNDSSSLKGKVTSQRAQLCAISAALTQIKNAGMDKRVGGWHCMAGRH